MSRPLSKRQKLYREYLKTDHWINLRDAAIKRDGGKCLVCGGAELLQVHHLKYRGTYQEGLLEDLETLCRTCHRLEHGIGPNLFEMKMRTVSRNMSYEKFPSKEDEVELVFLANLFGLDAKREVLGFFRLVSGMRIIMTNSNRWTSWLKKDREVQHRIWPWAEKKYERILSSMAVEEDPLTIADQAAVAAKSGATPEPLDRLVESASAAGGKPETL